MAVIQKKKLCWNCEGNVSLADETCPYCGVSVIPASLDGAVNAYNPPYHMGMVQENAIPRSPYHIEQDSKKNLEENEIETNSPEEEQEISVDEFKNVLLSLLFLIGGSMFFLFGLTLALFSHNGVFVLKWDGSYWYLYSLFSVPLLLLGWRALLKLEG